MHKKNFEFDSPLPAAPAAVLEEPTAVADRQ